MTITAVFESIEEMKEFAELFREPEKKGKENEGGSCRPQETAPVSAPDAAQPPAAQPQPCQVQQAFFQPAPAPAAVPTSAPQYKLDDLARAAMALMDSGRQADLQGLLARFNVAALPMLPQAQYGAFATALREMGARI